jgi:Arc/MetJ-type ribon-helix-helix transcriptional regulator
MATAKVAISLDQSVLKKLDSLVKQGVFENRSSAIQEALSDRLKLVTRQQFEQECLKLSQDEEKDLANETLSAETSWPEY